MSSQKTSGPPKRSITIAGHRTSLSLETEFWAEIKKRAAAKNLSTTQLIAKIDADRGSQNLSSACRVFVLKELQSK